LLLSFCLFSFFFPPIFLICSPFLSLSYFCLFFLSFFLSFSPPHLLLISLFSVRCLNSDLSKTPYHSARSHFEHHSPPNRFSIVQTQAPTSKSVLFMSSSITTCYCCLISSGVSKYEGPNLFFTPAEVCSLASQSWIHLYHFCSHNWLCRMDQRNIHQSLD
jgi:hypothetical protein